MKLILLCIPVVTFAALNVWSQAVTEPPAVQGPGVVVIELPTSAKADFLKEDANIQGGSDGR
ncbi:hypothetical protein ARGLB_118_00440 [Arthrobacter globiformis NBRC 12137]|jgi:hypothetical protein|uniref:Uncharacterized protein n=2 Tax=Arthrobacter globiformis TaxID=1665 RepID=H0QU79_ARTG1|nr:hypothetical protein ARGLB_118_00440 [Arthrobacter globiformis NBRC 12137]